MAINPEDSDVEMISEDDFIEDDPDRPAEYPPDSVHVHFFISYVKLCEIMASYYRSSTLWRPSTVERTLLI